VLAGIAVAVLTGLVAGYLVWWEKTHVRTERAVVCTSIVSLASEVDARLEELLVEPGQHVTRGQLVARLDDSALRATLKASEEDRAIKHSLYVQARTAAALTETAVEADIALARTRVDIAKAKVASYKAEAAVKQARLPAELSRAQAQRDEARARLHELQAGLRKELIEEARARLDTARARVKMIELQLEISREMVKKGLESGLMLQTRETDLVARRNEEREATMRLALLEAGASANDIEAAQQVLAAREADLALATESESDRLAVAADLAARQAEVREAEAAMQQAVSQTVQVDLARERVKAAAAELSKAEADVVRCQAGLRSLSVCSPVDGTVLRTFDKVGEVSRKAAPMMLVADDDAGFWIEGFVSEREAGLVRPDQPARVEIVVGSDRYIAATVKTVALSTTALSRESVSDAERLPLESGPGLVWLRLTPDEPLTDVLPGMSARAVIKVGHQ
jgi:multidrug resistance efflux pump